MRLLIEIKVNDDRKSLPPEETQDPVPLDEVWEYQKADGGRWLNHRDNKFYY